MAYLVTAPYVTVETDVGPGRARVDIPCGRQLPPDVPAEDVERLVAAGDVEGLDEPDEASVPAGPDPEAVPEGSIAVVLAWVDGDAARARRALHVEELKGDKARMTLVNDLSKLADA